MVNAPKVSTLTLTSADVIGEVEVQNSTSWRDRSNTVVPSYREESQLWEVVAGQAVSSSVYVEEDGGETKTIEVEYPLVQQAKQAHQLAVYELCNGREFLTMRVTAGIRMLNAKVGEAITVNLPEINANGQKCLVVSREFNPADWSVVLGLKSETDAKHPFALGQTQVAPPSPALDGYNPAEPGAPNANAWSITSTTITAEDGVIIPALVVSGENDDPNTASILVEYRPTGSTEWINWGSFAKNTRQIEITAVTRNTAYDVAVSYRTVLGVTSDRLLLSGTAGDQSIDWNSGVIVGDNKPEDNATVGAPDGTFVGNQPVQVIVNAAVNFNSRNDRNASPITAPVILTDGTAIDHTLNTDGSANISFEWTWAGNNADIDGWLVTMRSSASSAAYTLGALPAEETVQTTTAEKRALILSGVPADQYYTFYVQAYRVVDPDVAAGGLIRSGAVRSTATGENPYRPSANVAFAGNVTGTIAGVAAATVVAQAAVAKPIDTTAPNQVTGLTVNSTAAFDAVGGQIITLNIGWTASTAADLAGYNIEIAQGASSTTFIPVAAVGKSATTFSYSAGILANTVYRVRVAAYDDSANLGNWSAIVNVTTAKDTAAPAAPTGLTYDAALNTIFLKWTNPTASDLDHIDVYEHTGNSSGSAVRIGYATGVSGQTSTYTRTGLAAGEQRYYWLKAVDTSGNASGFSAVLAAKTSNGVGLTDIDQTLGLQIPQGVTSLPNAPTWTGSTLVRNGAEGGALYELKGGQWVKAIDMAGISGQVVEDQIGTGAITGPKLGPEAVNTGNVAKLAITASLMADGTITSNKVGPNEIKTINIGPSAVTASEMASGSVLATKLAIGDTSNMVGDANCVDASYWTAPGGVTSGPTNSTVASTNRLWMTPTTAAANIASGYIPVEVAKEYFVSLGIGFHTGSGATLTGKVDWYSYNGGYSYLSSSQIGPAVTTAGLYNKVSGIVTAPANARACMVLVSKSASSTALSPTLMEPVMRRAAAGEMIVDGAITTPKVSAGAIVANHVAAGAITATKVVLGDTSNMVPDPGFNDIASWTGATYTLSTTTSAFATDYYLRILASAASPQQVRSAPIPVEKSTSYAFYGIPFTSTANTATSTISVEWYSDVAASTLISSVDIGSATGTAQNQRNAIVTAPANARRAKIVLSRSAGTSDTGEARFANPVMRRAATGELIVDGAITADKVAANSITASKLMIGDTSNMFGDAAMVDPAYYSGDYIITATGLALASTNRLRTTSQTAASMITTGCAQVEPGKDYFFSTHAYIETGASTATVAIDWFTLATGGTLISTDIIGTSTGTNGGTPRTFGTFKSPTNARAVRFTWSKAASAAASQGSFGEPIIRRATSGELIVDGAITANKLSVNSVDASKIAAKSIIASKLSIGDSSNMVADPNMSDLACWRGNTVTSALAVGTYTSSNFLFTASTTDRVEFGSTPIQVEAGKDYFVTAGVRNSGNSIPTLFVINWYSDVDATVYISNSLVGTNSTSSFATLLSTIVTAPSNARTATMQFIKDASATASGLQAVSPIFRRASSGELIVDGSIVASKIAAGAITANKMSVAAGGNIEDNRLPTGLYVGTTGDTIGTVQTQASSAFDGTSGYRVTGVPTNAPVASTITVTANANGTRNIRLDWAAYTQGTRKADLLMLFWRKASTTPTVNDSAISINVNTAAASYYIFEGVNPTDVMSFGIAAARRTENGIEVGAIQTVAAWTNVATATANYTGNINGTSAATIRANALNPASVINAAATTIDPGKITITGTTTLADWRYGNTTTIDGGYIATNTITANAIAANTITASRLAIGDTANMVDNGWSTGNLDGWVTQNVTNFSRDDTAGAAAGWRIQSIGRDQAVSAPVSVTPGESYYMQAWCFNRHAGRANLYAFGTADLTLAGAVTITSAGFTDAKNGWTKVSGIYTVPTGVTALRMCLQSERTAGSGDPTFWSKPVMTRAMSGELIVDGAITASKIKAGEILSEHIVVGTLAGDRIVAGSITINQMGANSVSANQLTANSVTADKIKAGEITGDKINSATSLPGSLTISGTGFSLGTINNALGNTGQLVTYNGDFLAWAGTLPDGFGGWGDSGTRTKVVGQRGGNSVRITATANGQNGMVQTGDNGTNAGNYPLYAGRWIVIEADITLNSGTLQGAGILVRAQGGGDTYLRFASDPEVWGGVAGNGSAGQSYSFRKLVATTSGSSTRPEMYLMNHYGGIGSMATANDITWHHAGWRFASDGEYNPAAQVNAASTQIDPGKILISGSTTLASWRNGGDNTKIEGGSIAANTITANKLTIGNRNLNFPDLSFQTVNSGATLRWDGFYIQWRDANNNAQQVQIAASSITPAAGFWYIYWTEGATGIAASTDSSWATRSDAVCLCTWLQGTNRIVQNYGSTIIDGNRITTGSINADRLAVNTLSAIAADIGTVNAGMIRNQSGTTQIDVTNGRIMFNNGTTMKVQGNGFGTNNQFLEWFGPALSNINQCSETNATSYQKVSGQAYFGGALLAGTLRNAVQTSSLASNASVTLPTFGSNGGTIVVNCSWVYSYTSEDTYAANSTGLSQYNAAISGFGSQYVTDTGGGHAGSKPNNVASGSFTLNLRRSGGLAQSVSGANGTLGLEGVRPTPGDSPGRITWTYSFSQSFTFTDPELNTTSRNYSADISKTMGTGTSPVQRISINTAE
ncbi:DUF7359 domain-containing protein [Sphingobium yanoikuyae]|uniref:DUF7359 domain-containing protein n=1 Tax=Sphingobium yanoikuyae TaxID=13690 RepID=UPI001378356D|nr:hypothetical protein [Sphingobium yanoikuyae]NBB41369.1 hypothetical protein [Sphingobium yanoikuyae]